jgi:hypothetical protein
MSRPLHVRADGLWNKAVDTRELAMPPMSPRASLLGLPVELRLQIYNYLVTNVHINLRRPWSYRDYTDRKPWSWLHISQQTRAEILPIFYQSVQFQVLDGFTAKRLCAWLDAIGTDAVAHLRRLRFECEGHCVVDGVPPEYASRFDFVSRFLKLTLCEELTTVNARCH